MLKSLSLALALFCIVSTSYAKPAVKSPEPPAAAVPVCKSPDALIEKFKDATVVADLTGDVLKKFNSAYEAATKEPAPTTDFFDRVVVFASKDKPDSEVYLLIASKDGCVIGAQPIPKQMFNSFRHPGEGI